MQLSFCYCKDNKNVTSNINNETNRKSCQQTNQLKKLKTSTILMKNFYTRHEEYMDQKILGTNSNNYNTKKYKNTKFQIDGATTNNHYLFEKRNAIINNSKTNKYF